ncbi:DNA-formamidopyrimidine glycosylase family protein [Terracoccus luteus]|uniref:DNA-(apurinic or apyrimidinic site) lyase n=1 Tax=Terracoccus luteus TaxID=53356 RepID=A0A495Y2I6_9MICO|nr:DNA-formamidopyrimidine glycosylase family protein [Terracoccus luteus]MBB2986493.1 endonuclease-8 [Terracoccus luteus]MCP2171918.1 endonuclease-8 [Terracoccus luteus]RKT79256.1 endonuclease-8 [Terracoccus luteus]
MPEGDTVWRTATRLHQALAGKLIVASDLRWPDIATADLTDRTTIEVVSRGKHVLHRIEGGLTLHSHLRMEGQWRIEATPSLAPRWRRNPNLRALVSATDWTALGMRLGMLDLVPTDREGDLVGHLGPDVLGPDWDAEAAIDNLLRADLPVGEALLDQRNLAGVGTMWCAETLFLERVPPWTPTTELGRERLQRIVARAHRLIDNGKNNAVQTSTGSYRLDEAHYVHARSGRPCRRCGTTVRVAPIGQEPRTRTMFYCPRCQGGLGPTDDGRTQRPLGSEGSSKRSPRAL